MRLSVIIAAIVGATMAVATAIPAAALDERAKPPKQQRVCVATNNNPVCCATDVLGLADLDCAPRKSLIQSSVHS